MSKGKVLVCGGTGYIGSHTTVELLNQGFDVMVIDNLSNSREEVVHSIRQITGKTFEFRNLDLLDLIKLNAEIKDNKFDAVIHFAAFKSVNESVTNPIKYYRNNFDSLINLADCCNAHNIRNFVFSSSCSVYGNADKLPVDENAPLKKAESPYGYTKQVSERILEDISNVTSLKTIALRYFNPVGAHESALIGEYPLNAPDNLVPVITQTAIGLRESMSVFGNDYDTADGTPVRDYIHVVDIAEAHIEAVKRLMNNSSPKKFEIFNLGTGKGNTVLEVINAFERVNKVKLNYTIKPRREGDVEKIYANTTLVKKELGWSTTRGLDEMMSSAWKWELALKKKRN